MPWKEDRMFGLGKPKITIWELAAIMFQAVIDPQAESRDWDIVKASVPERGRFRSEWFCFRTFVTLSVAESAIDQQAYRALVDTYFRTLPSYAPADVATLQKRVTRYINTSNSGKARLQYGSIADTCMEFSRLCSGDPNDSVLTALADVTALLFGRAQLTRLKSFKLDWKSFVVTDDGTVIKKP